MAATSQSPIIFKGNFGILFVWIIILVLYKDVIQAHGLNENFHFVRYRMEAEIFWYLKTVDI